MGEWSSLSTSDSFPLSVVFSNSSSSPQLKHLKSFNTSFSDTWASRLSLISILSLQQKELITFSHSKCPNKSVHTQASQKQANKSWDWAGSSSLAIAVPEYTLSESQQHIQALSLRKYAICDYSACDGSCSQNSKGGPYLKQSMSYTYSKSFCYWDKACNTARISQSNGISY